MNDLHIEVTQADIDAGKREDCEACPIALAVRRILPSELTDWDIEVSSEAIWLYDVEEDNQHGVCWWNLPESARQFIRAFDQPLSDDDDDEPIYAEVYPFSFTAKAVEP